MKISKQIVIVVVILLFVLVVGATGVEGSFEERFLEVEWENFLFWANKIYVQDAQILAAGRGLAEGISVSLEPLLWIVYYHPDNPKICYLYVEGHFFFSDREETKMEVEVMVKYRSTLIKITYPSPIYPALVDVEGLLKALGFEEINSKWYAR